MSAQLSDIFNVPFIKINNLEKKIIKNKNSIKKKLIINRKKLIINRKKLIINKKKWMIQKLCPCTNKTIINNKKEFNFV